MNTTESEDLAVRLSQTWPKGLPAPAWDDALRNLDAGGAGTAYVRLRATVSLITGPSIADFLSTYNSLNTKPYEPRPNCETCGGNGWEPVWTTNDEGVEYSNGVTPCRCPSGRQREEVHQRIIDHNERELANVLGHDPRRGAAA